MKKLGYKFMISMFMLGICVTSANAHVNKSQNVAQMLKKRIEYAAKNNITISDAMQRMLEHMRAKPRAGEKISVQKRSAGINGGITVVIISQIWQNGAWVNSYKSIASFIDNTYRILTAFEGYEWVNGAWENDGKTEITFVNGFITEMFMSVWSNGIWMPFMQITHEYDGALVKRTYTKIDTNNTGTLVNLLRLDLTYDNNSFLLTETNFNWNGTSWDAYSKLTYTNNAQGFPTEILTEFITGGLSLLYQKMLFTYTASNLVATLILQNYDLATASWRNSSRTSTTYSGGNPIQETYEMWDGTGWYWVSQVLTTYIAANIAEVLNQVWTGSAWENDNREVYTWANNILTMIVYQLFVNNAWTDDSRDLYEESQTAVAESIALPENFSLGNYPNPFNPETKISYSLPEASTVSLVIFDVLGNTVRTLVQDELVESGNHEIKWDGRDATGQVVSSGVYFYRLSAKNFSKTKRCILLR